MCVSSPIPEYIVGKGHKDPAYVICSSLSPVEQSWSPISDGSYSELLVIAQRNTALTKEKP